MGTKESEGFKVIHDPFGGIIIKTQVQSFSSAEEFDEKLKVAVPNWEKSGVRGLWAKIPKDQSHLIPVFVKYGLDFNHAKPGYVMMACWLPTSEPSMIPNYANQYLGVGGMVVNSKQEILVIKEKYHHLSKVAPWKFPGGTADSGEDIGETACREVFEETGIRAEFVGVISYRHQHNFRHGCSDFYFMCLLRPTSEDQKIDMCKQEIADCRWMHIEEFLQDETLTDTNRHFVQQYKELVLDKNTIISPSAVLSFTKKSTNLIYGPRFMSDDPQNIP